MIAFVFCGNDQPENEWLGTLNKLNIKFHRFRDETNQWYQHLKWDNEIQKALDMHGNPNLVFGASMGGWASLYFQPLIKANRVIAFSPQVTTIPSKLYSFKDKKNNKWGEILEATGYPGDNIPLSDGKSIIYYSSGHYGDMKHAAIAKQLNYEIKFVTASVHNVAGVLKTQGELLNILQDGLNYGTN